MGFKETGMWVAVSKVTAAATDAIESAGGWVKQVHESPKMFLAYLGDVEYTGDEPGSSWLKLSNGKLIYYTKSTGCHKATLEVPEIDDRWFRESLLPGESFVVRNL